MRETLYQREAREREKRLRKDDYILHSGKQGSKWGYNNGVRNGNRTAKERETEYEEWVKEKSKPHEHSELTKTIEAFLPTYNPSTGTLTTNYKRGFGRMAAKTYEALIPIINKAKALLQSILGGK